MLASKLSMHDVADVEGLCWHVVGLTGFSLTWTERDDLCAHLLGEVWMLGERYQPGGPAFSTWATTSLRLRAIDWLRQRRGRTRWVFGDGTVHERDRPPVESLDGRRERGLADTVTGGAGDRAATGFATLDGLVAAGGSTPDRDLALIRELVSRPARGRA